MRLHKLTLLMMMGLLLLCEVLHMLKLMITLLLLVLPTSTCRYSSSSSWYFLQCGAVVGPTALTPLSCE